VADVRARDRVERIFARWQPEVVFHAAAYKHVPLMEENVSEAVLNNIGGLRNVLEISCAAGVERFVFISTDKAVEPVSVMGMTKSIGERLVQAAGRETGRPYVAVRFGNVLGSRGSVVPLFQRQIAAGGPVTVTHPEVRRYFMSLSEAVGLVLQAASRGEAGEQFVLEMGEQIEIQALAEQLIELSGLKAGREIEIVYTGLRPGERLAEKLTGEDETVIPAEHEKIFKIQGQMPTAAEHLYQEVSRLIRLAREGDDQRTRELLAEIAS
jgi:FlaA1/EpsC-like NDP-sugar epimerase